MNTTYLEYTMGLFIGLAFVLFFFGLKIEAKSIPNIKINIGTIVKNSHIFLFNKHIHHWFINLCILLLVLLIEPYYSSQYWNIIKGFALVLILHGLLY